MAICRSACDRSRSCQLSSLWDVGVMNLSSPHTAVFSVSLTAAVTALCLRAILSCGNFHMGSFQETRSGQSVNTQSTCRPSNFITPCSTSGNHFLKTALYEDQYKIFSIVKDVSLFTFITNYYITLTSLWQWIIIGHLYQVYSYYKERLYGHHSTPC